MKKLLKENGSGLTLEYCVYAIVWRDYFQLAERYKYVYSMYFWSISNDFEVFDISTTSFHAMFGILAQYILAFASQIMGFFSTFATRLNIKQNKTLEWDTKVHITIYISTYWKIESLTIV